MDQITHDKNCKAVRDQGYKHGACPYSAPSASDSQARFDAKVNDWGYLDFDSLKTHKLGDLFSRSVSNHESGNDVDAWNLWALAEYLDHKRYLALKQALEVKDAQ